MSISERYQRGLTTLYKIGGDEGLAPLNALAEIAPDLARYTVEFAYGDILSRPILDLRTRELCTVAALAAMGRAPTQLRYHIRGALNAGCLPSDVVETVMLCVVYAGFPAALNGLFAVREVFQERTLNGAAAPDDGSPDRHARGMLAFAQLHGETGAGFLRDVQETAPELARYLIEFGYGDILARAALADRIKALATIALLTALATTQPQLVAQIGAALKAGATRDEIVEAIQQMALYAGFPAAFNGIAAARAAYAQIQ